MPNKRISYVTIATILLLFAVGAAQAALDMKQNLGKLLYFDENLSTPAGMSCATCHHPNAGFADPDQGLPVSQGIIPTRFGNRNSPSSAYAAFSPDFHWDEDEEMFVGGQFWDGRAANLTEQAKGPFLNPLEMKNPNKRRVVSAVAKSSYAGLFKQVYGSDAFKNVDAAYDKIAEAIAAFEASSEVNQFTSKFDAVMEGRATFTEQEARGLALFNDPMKGNCAVCHPSTPGPYHDKALFTDYSYDNLGVPKNWNNPFLYLGAEFNPDGVNYTDYGLGGFLMSMGYPGYQAELGKFKVPTLRNIAKTAPYMHNGIFATLKEVVHFYNTRDVASEGWPPPEVPENVNDEELGNLGLTDQEEDDIVAFMMTLTDGYVPEGPPPF